jgi:hypothetical protein
MRAGGLHLLGGRKECRQSGAADVFEIRKVNDKLRVAAIDDRLRCLSNIGDEVVSSAAGGVMSFVAATLGNVHDNGGLDNSERSVSGVHGCAHFRNVRYDVKKASRAARILSPGFLEMRRS